MISFRKIKEVIIYLFEETWSYRKSFFVVYILNFVVNAIEPFITIVGSKVIIDELLGNKDVDKIICYVSTMIVLCFCARFILIIFSENLQKNYYDIINNQFEVKLALKNMKIKYEMTEDKKYLDEAQKAKTGIGLSYSGGIQGIAGTFSNVLSAVITLGGSIGIITSKFPLLLIVLLINVFINSIVNRKKSVLQVKQFEKMSYIARAFNYLYYTLSDVRYAHDIRLFQADKMMLVKTDEYNEQQNVIQKNQQNEIFRFLKFSSVNMAITAAISFLYLGYMALNGLITVGEFTMASSTSTVLLNAINRIISDSIELQKKCTYANNYVSYMNKQDGMNMGKNAKLHDKRNLTIEFKHVYFAYPNCKDYVLKDVSLKINAGEHLAVVGQNGAGKTTFIKLICRLYDVTEGEILLNGINIKEYDYDAYIKIISAVFQDFKLLALSLKENVVIDKEDEVLYEDLMELMEKVGLSKKVKELPQGLDTAIFKHFDIHGFIPSGGEQQKIAIARALFKNAPIVILDEPTAALDPIAEYEIYQQFNDMVYEKTAIYISHRLSSCRFCDRIAVFFEGKIVEYGTHDELMKQKDSHYAELYNAQATYYQK